MYDEQCSLTAAYLNRYKLGVFRLKVLSLLLRLGIFLSQSQTNPAQTGHERRTHVD